MGPAGQPEDGAGHWALSGPGWAAEWCQGGESGFLSIATAADDDKAAASTDAGNPSGRPTTTVWVRYGDWREQAEPFEIVLEQPGAPAWTGEYGRQPAIDEDNEMKLYWGWASSWDEARREVSPVKRPAKLKSVSTHHGQSGRAAANRRHRPVERHRLSAADQRASARRHRRRARVVPHDTGDRLGAAGPHGRSFELPDNAWKLHTFHDQGFVYLWNINAGTAPDTWLSDKPDRVRVPYQIADERVRKDFEQKYAGQDNPPIFSDPRHGANVSWPVGAGRFCHRPDRRANCWKPASALPNGSTSIPDRPWGMMMNYQPRPRRSASKGIDIPRASRPLRRDRSRERAWATSPSIRR